MQDYIMDLLEVLDLLPDNIKKKLNKIIDKFSYILLIMFALPEYARNKFGNWFAHNVLKALKDAGVDNEENRIRVAYWTRLLFDLDPEWMPGFDMTPP